MIGYLLIHRVDTYQSQTELTLCTSSIHSRSKLYSIQHYVIKFVSDLSKVGGFSPVSSTNKIVHINLTEISLIVEFNNLLLSSIPVRSKVYSIQPYVIKFVSVTVVWWFSPCSLLVDVVLSPLVFQIHVLFCGL